MGYRKAQKSKRAYALGPRVQQSRQSRNFLTHLYIPARLSMKILLSNPGNQIRQFTMRLSRTQHHAAIGLDRQQVLIAFLDPHSFNKPVGNPNRKASPPLRNNCFDLHKLLLRLYIRAQGQ